MDKVANLSDLKNIFNGKLASLTSVGVNAFNRTGPEHLYDNYQIIALKDSEEDQYISKLCSIFNLARETGKDFSQAKMNAETILSQPLAVDFINKQSKPSSILLYKSRKSFEKLIADNGWQLLNAKSEIADKFENKTYFRGIMEEIKTGLIPGQIALARDLGYDQLAGQYGKFVVQEPKGSGGKGTYFINSKQDFIKVVDQVNKNKVDKVLITKFIKGFSPSITACATKWGVFYARPQMQALDIKEVISEQRGSGQFCGHEWGDTDLINEEVAKQASLIAKQVGEKLFQAGYRGVFGLDLLVDQDTKQVYVIECNPRFLGTFPSITSLQIKNNQIPIIALHLAEFLDLEIDWQIDPGKELANIIQGSQLIIYNKEDKLKQVQGNVKPGVYSFENNELKYIREGYDFLALDNPSEFVITDGMPKTGAKVKGWGRICRILFNDKILADPINNQLTDKTKMVVKKIYQELNLKNINGSKTQS